MDELLNVYFLLYVRLASLICVVSTDCGRIVQEGGSMVDGKNGVTMKYAKMQINGENHSLHVHTVLLFCFILLL